MADLSCHGYQNNYWVSDNLKFKHLSITGFDEFQRYTLHCGTAHPIFVEIIFMNFRIFFKISLNFSTLKTLQFK